MTNDISPDVLREHIALSFKHIYPSSTPTVSLNDDETILVSFDNIDLPSFRCVIDSDDDEYLRFTVFDDDDDPSDDDYEYLSIRILAAPREPTT